MSDARKVVHGTESVSTRKVAHERRSACEAVHEAKSDIAAGRGTTNGRAMRLAVAAGQMRRKDVREADPVTDDNS